MLELRNDEKQHLVVELEDLKQDFAALENELEHATRAREKGDRSASGDEGVGREELEKVCSNFPCIRIPLLPSERSEFSTGGGTLTFILLHRTWTPTATEPFLSLSNSKTAALNSMRRSGKLRSLLRRWMSGGARSRELGERRTMRGGRRRRFGRCVELFLPFRYPFLWNAGTDDRDDLRPQLLDDKEADIEELSRRVEQLMQQVAEKEAELAAEEEEVEALTHDLQKVRFLLVSSWLLLFLIDEAHQPERRLQLGAQIFELESEIETKDTEIDALRSDLAAVDKELEDKQGVHEQVVSALKEVRLRVFSCSFSSLVDFSFSPSPYDPQKLNSHKSRLSDLQIQHESLSTSSSFLTSKVEDLALANAKLEERARSDQEEKRRLQDEAEEIMNALRKEEEERDEDAERFAREREELEAVRPFFRILSLPFGCTDNFLLFPLPLHLAGPQIRPRLRHLHPLPPLSTRIRPRLPSGRS
jgi:predicted  nucleic acid-binding Zn-ribbon protein